MTQSAPSSFPPSDAQLLAAFDQDRRQDAFAQLVTRHGNMVLAVCRSVLGNTADAEDAAQAVFLTLAQKSSLRLPSLAGWLHRVAWYVSARAAEARAVRQRHEKEAATMASQHANSPTSAFDSSLAPELLHAALAGLPDKYRIPLILHHLEGRSQEETAAFLGCRVGAVAMRLNRGRQMLRHRLSRRVAQPVPAASILTALAPSGTALPHAFVATAAKAAALAVTQQLATTFLVSGSTLALTKGALAMLFWSKVKLVAAMIAIVLLAGGTVGTFVALAQTSSTPTQIAGGGNITALTPTSVTITRSDVPTTVSMGASTVIKIDGVVKTAADLRTGLYAMALGAGTAATEIRAYTPQAPATQPAAQSAQIAGGGNITALTPTSVTITRSDVPTTVSMGASTVIKIDGVVKTAADLKTGLYAMALGAGTTATEIRAYTPQAPATQPAAQPTQIAGGGNITALTATSVTITRDDKPNTVTMGANTVIKVDGAVKTPADLKTGFYAMALGAGTAATEIRAYTLKAPVVQPAPQPVQIAGGGNITALTATSVTITRGDKPTTVTMGASTVIKIDGAVKTAADLKTGFYAMALGSGTAATEISAYTPKAPAAQPAAHPTQIAGGGFITALTATSVTITRGSKPTTVAFDAATVIKLDDKVVTAASLKVGLYAMALGANSKAVEIRAFSPKPK